MIRNKLSNKSIERFWAKVSPEPNFGCYLWTACTNEKGYGIFGVGKETDKAHRIAWRIEIGEIPKGMGVLHKCDNPLCVNPKHLFLGTSKDNVEDMIRKGRNSPPPRMGGHNKIIIPKDCVDLLGKIPDHILGKKYGLSKHVMARNRRARNIPSSAELTGNYGKFKKGMPHPRWSRNGG